ncbi:FG-GAP repeat domain-containing protein [Pseudovibrio denitrificans]|uniref:FG-GAP repeat domain-containing protein n=1 Tax=Pseudovibrio denitrificans TaxID=258256 RepID=UPI000AC4806B|nr:VCBS repeat-containing protein [Pseudovibrio denitrificans]
MLASKADTHGNTVSYTYDCSAFPTCLIDEITYQASSVVFNWEDRPDPLSYATGLKLGKLSKRLQSVVVKADDSVLRAYKLSYDQSPATKKSLISGIQEFGSDATLAEGAVSGGTKLPQHTFSYSGQTPQISEAGHQKYNKNSSGYAHRVFNHNDDKQLEAIVREKKSKFNCSFAKSDHLNDLDLTNHKHSCYTDNYFEAYSLRTSIGRKHELYLFYMEYYYDIFLPQYYDLIPSLDPTYYGTRVGDFDGDGLDDTLGKKGVLKTIDGHRMIYTTHSKGKFTKSTTEDWAGDDNDYIVGEFNGDGLADLFEVKSNKITVKRSNGEDGFVNLFAKSGSYGSKVAVGDLNGDGITDFLTYHAAPSSKPITRSAIRLRHQATSPCLDTPTRLIPRFRLPISTATAAATLLPPGGRKTPAQVHISACI